MPRPETLTSPTASAVTGANAVTISGLVLQPSYGPDAQPTGLRYMDRDIAEAGKFPFTRGLFREGYQIGRAHV